MNARTALLAIAALALALPAAAHAQQAKGTAWKVGQSYVIRFEHLNLDLVQDRQSLLAQIERSARKLCEGQRSNNRRAACEAEVAANALKPTPAAVKQAVEIARIERDGFRNAQMQAQR
jgi:UrcA family protein